MKALKSDKIQLRALEPEDVDLLFLWENDPENWRVSETKAPFSRHVLSEYAKSTQDIFTYRQIRFMILAKDQVVGTIDLFDYDPVNRAAGVGILIQEEDQKGKGYATDALQLINAYGKDILNLKNIFASMHESNKASIHLFEKCGYELVGKKKKNLFSQGNWEDELIYQRILEV